MDKLNLALTVGFGIFGVWQFMKSKGLDRTIKKMKWGAYRNASVIFGGLKTLLQKAQNNANIASDLSILIGQAEQVMNNQIEEIAIYETITNKKIEEWIEHGRICHPTHKDEFNKYADK